MIYLKLFFEFFRVGLFSVGGGLATLPFLYDLSDRTAWFTHGDIADMIAIAESTPGAIGVNMATYAGYLTGGVPGGIIATMGLIAPAIVVIYLVSRVLTRFSENAYVQYAFYGLRAASLAMIAAAGYNVLKISILNLNALSEGNYSQLIVWKGLILGIILLVLQRRFPKIHPVFFIALSAVVGIIFHFSV